MAELFRTSIGQLLIREGAMSGNPPPSRLTGQGPRSPCGNTLASPRALDSIPGCGPDRSPTSPTFGADLQNFCAEVRIWRKIDSIRLAAIDRRGNIVPFGLPAPPQPPLFSGPRAKIVDFKPTPKTVTNLLYSCPLFGGGGVIFLSQNPKELPKKLLLGGG